MISVRHGHSNYRTTRPAGTTWQKNRPRRRLVAAGKLRGVPGRRAAERVSSGPLPILAAKAATAIPVVFAAAGDPVAHGPRQSSVVCSPQQLVCHGPMPGMFRWVRGA